MASLRPAPRCVHHVKSHSQVKNRQSDWLVERSAVHSSRSCSKAAASSILSTWAIGSLVMSSLGMGTTTETQRSRAARTATRERSTNHSLLRIDPVAGLVDLDV